MNKSDINPLIKTLKESGYFKLHYGNIKRFNKFYGGFEELDAVQFRQHLAKEYLSQKDAIEYVYCIINRLDDFPIKQFNNYDKYLRLLQEKPFNLIEKDFINRYYNRNSNLKRIDVKLRTGALETYLQVLINHDVFYSDVFYRSNGSGRLYQYDVSGKSFVEVNKNNIGSIIDCSNPDLSNDVLQMGLKYGCSELINIQDTVEVFNRTKSNEERLKAYQDDYEYIVKLIESFN